MQRVLSGPVFIRRPMPAVGGFILLILVAAQICGLARAQTLDDSLKIYAVNIVETPPFRKQSTGYGIYLGQGTVITAAHVVGHLPSLKNPHVLIAGQNLPAQVIKEGSFESIDLALLSVDQKRLPVGILLRRNPLCTEPPRVGEKVVDVTPKRTTRAQVISPLLVPPNLRKRYNTLITTPQISGSGIFDAERKCLVGIMSAKVTKQKYAINNGKLMIIADGYAGYFVSAATIAYFIPPELHSLISQSPDLNFATP